VLWLSEKYYQLSQLKTEFIENLRKRTITAIIVISIAYIISLMLLVVMFIISRTNYCFFALVIPLLTYVWLITYGGKKHVNNHYSFKQTSEGGILLYKKRGEKYSTYIWVFILIYYISSIIRLIREMRNLKIINTELIYRSKQA
jgi:phosphatidylserine synthase